MMITGGNAVTDENGSFGEHSQSLLLPWVPDKLVVGTTEIPSSKQQYRLGRCDVEHVPGNLLNDDELW